MCIYCTQEAITWKKTTQRIVEQFPNLKEKIVRKTGKFALFDDAIQLSNPVDLHLCTIGFLFEHAREAHFDLASPL